MIILFFAFVVLSLFGSTLFPPADKIIYGGDVLTQFYFWKGYLAQNLRAGVIPFWNPYNFSGTPFLAHPSTTVFYPFTLLFVLLPLNLAFSFNFAVHLFIAGFGIYKLVRSYTKSLAALSGATVFILGGFFASRVYAGHVEIFSTVAWLPWVFWSMRRLLYSPAKVNFILLILLFSLEILAGYSAVVLFTLELLGAYLIYHFILTSRKKEKISLLNFVYPVAGLLFGFAITSIQWLPILEFVKLSIRGDGLAYELASWGSLPLSGLKLFFDPSNYNELLKLPYGFDGYVLPNFFEYFSGWTVILVPSAFILIKLLQRLKVISRKGQNLSVSPDFWFFLMMIFVFLWLSFGNQAKFNLHFILYQLIPLYRNIRIPSQHLIMVVFILPIMFGLVIDKFKNKWLQLAFFSLVLVELFPYSKKFYLLADLPEKKYDKKLIELLPNLPEKSRLLSNFNVVSPVLESFDFNAALKFHIPTTSGYDPMILHSYYEFIDIMNKRRSSSLPYYNVEIPPVNINAENINFLDIGYILLEDKEKKFALTIRNGTKRFHFIGNAIVIPDDETLKEELIKAENGVLLNTLYITKKELEKIPKNPDLNCGQDKKEKIETVKYNINEITLTAEVNCNGFLSSSEIYYPGWKASVDGKEVPILKSNYSFRSLYLPAGKHQVKFYYSPEIYILGGLISLFSLVVSILFIHICYKSHARGSYQVC